MSRVRGLSERVRSILGIYPVRCRACDARFFSSIWHFRYLRYARCPRCYRMDLSTWSEQYYNPPTLTRAMLRLGATPYRCEYCRCNFASFRACKERFSWRKRREGRSSPEYKEDSALGA